MRKKHQKLEKFEKEKLEKHIEQMFNKTKIGHEFNSNYEVFLNSNKHEVSFTQAKNTLFTFHVPETCPETLDDLKALKLAQNCDDNQLEILLKWFKSNATTKILGREKEWSNFEDVINAHIAGIHQKIVYGNMFTEFFLKAREKYK